MIGWIKDHGLSVFLVWLTVTQTGVTWFLMKPFLDKKQPVQEFWGEWMMSVVADSYGAALLIIAGIAFHERRSSQDG